MNGQIWGPSELGRMSVIEASDNRVLASLRLVVDSGTNVIKIEYDDKDGREPTLTVESGAVYANSVLAELNNLYNDYLGLYGDTVVTYPDNRKIIVLNDRDMIQQYNKQKLQLVSRYPNLYYTLLEFLDLSRRTPFKENPLDVLEMFRKLDKNIKGTELGKKLNKDLLARIATRVNSLVGQPVVDFLVETNKGELFQNAELLGAPYIIAFSATWCVPCQEYLPILKQLYDRYNDKGLEIIYFNLDDDEEKWDEHITRNELKWINVSERTEMHNSKIAKLFNVNAIPNYFVIDRKGNVLYNDKQMGDTNFDLLEEYVVKALNRE